MHPDDTQRDDTHTDNTQAGRQHTCTQTTHMHEAHRLPATMEA